MFSAFLALAFSVAVCVHLTVGFDGLITVLRDAYLHGSKRLRSAYRHSSERLREALARATRRRSTQES
jgi:hypothetical protein